MQIRISTDLNIEGREVLSAHVRRVVESAPSFGRETPRRLLSGLHEVIFRGLLDVRLGETHEDF